MISKIRAWLSRSDTPPAIATPLAETIPPEWLAERWGLDTLPAPRLSAHMTGREVTIKATISYPGSRVSDIKIGDHLVRGLPNATLIEAGARVITVQDLPNGGTRTVQHGENMQQIPKVNVDARGLQMLAALANDVIKRHVPTERPASKREPLVVEENYSAGALLAILDR